jgi:hypothetical protein
MTRILPPGTPSWVPFFADPRTPGVVYIGATDLQRSADRGSSWTAIVKATPGAVRAIGFPPEDPQVLYAGTLDGKVFRIEGPVGTADWNTTNTISTDVTFSGLPPGQQISALAVDPSGNVWVTFSSLAIGKESGEFSHEHVYFLKAGGTAWEARSNGLAIANPVNTIVIDPLDATKIYCGADRGVFSWDAANATWKLFDQGLPNAPVTLLRIHAPSRKLRAATYGRGLWERQLDPGNCSDYFLYMRKHIADAGSQPAADGTPHPYYQGHLCWHWQSPDIIVDSTVTSASPPTDPLKLYDEVTHVGARREQNNRVYVQFHNKGPFTVLNARVRVFFASASAGLPPLPAKLLEDPFSWTPGATDDWNHVGPTVIVGNMGPGTTRMAAWTKFVIPANAAQHSCMLAFVTSDNDHFEAAGITDPDELVIMNRKVALKNLDLDGPDYPDSTALNDGSQPAMKSSAMSFSKAGFTPFRQVRLHSGRADAWYQPGIHCANLPEDAVILIANNSGVKTRTPAQQTSAQAKAAIDAFKRIRDLPHELAGFDLENMHAHSIRPQSTVTFPELFVGHRKPVDVAVWIWSRKWDPETVYAYDILQHQGQNVIGGFTVHLEGMR